MQNTKRLFERNRKLIHIRNVTEQVNLETSNSEPKPEVSALFRFRFYVIFYSYTSPTSVLNAEREDMFEYHH